MIESRVVHEYFMFVDEYLDEQPIVDKNSVNILKSAVKALETEIKHSGKSAGRKIEIRGKKTHQPTGRWSNCGKWQGED